jgi:hypothetical protein
MVVSLIRACPFWQELERVKIGEEGAELLVREAVGDGRHHAASVDNGLGDEAVVRGQAAGQIFSLEHAFEAGAFRTARGIRVVASRAALVVDLAAFGLLRGQAQLRVGFERLVRPTSGKPAKSDEQAHQQKNPVGAPTS